MSLTDFGIGYSKIALILSGSMRIPLVPTMKPRKSTSFRKNLHFSGAVLKPTFSSRSNTALTSVACCSRVPLVKIRISSIYAITVMSRSSRKQLFTTS